MTVPSKLLNTDKHRIENNFHSLTLKYVIKFKKTMSEIIIRQMALPLQLLFHFFNHFPGLTFIGSLPQKYGYRTFLSYARFQPWLHGRNKDEEFCLLGHAQPECSNSFSVLDLSFALPVSSLLKIKIKFG
jgi:hypothetical protein